MQKLITLSFLLFGMLNIVSAQDIITLKNGDEIKAKVNEIDLKVIKYTKFDNQNGPIYSIDKEKVFMIKYQNGSKDVFNEISESKTNIIERDIPKPYESTPVQPLPGEPKNNNTISKVNIGAELSYIKGRVIMEQRKLRPFEVKSIMISNHEALNKYRGGRTFGTLGWISTILGMVDLGIGLSNSLNGFDASGTFAIANNGVRNWFIISDNCQF